MCYYNFFKFFETLSSSLEVFLLKKCGPADGFNMGRYAEYIVKNMFGLKKGIGRRIIFFLLFF